MTFNFAHARNYFRVDWHSILPVCGFDLCEQDVLPRLSMEKFCFTEFLLELQAEGAKEMLKQHVSVFESYFTNSHIFLQVFVAVFNIWV